MSRYTGFEVTVYADVAGTLFVLPWSPALVRALPPAGTAARSGLCVVVSAPVILGFANAGR